MQYAVQWHVSLLKEDQLRHCCGGAPRCLSRIRGIEGRLALRNNAPDRIIAPVSRQCSVSCVATAIGKGSVTPGTAVTPTQKHGCGSDSSRPADWLRSAARRLARPAVVSNQAGFAGKRDAQVRLSHPGACWHTSGRVVSSPGYLGTWIRHVFSRTSHRRTCQSDRPCTTLQDSHAAHPEVQASASSTDLAPFRSLTLRWAYFRS